MWTVPWPLIATIYVPSMLARAEKVGVERQSENTAESTVALSTDPYTTACGKHFADLRGATSAEFARLLDQTA
jgi:hypothetical protein